MHHVFCLSLNTTTCSGGNLVAGITLVFFPCHVYGRGWWYLETVEIAGQCS